MKYIISLLFLLVGCNSFDLDERWLPLKEIVERPSDPLEIYDGFSTTIGSKVYRSNLDDFIKANPPNTIGFDMLMYHEQVHSKRQFKMGLYKWLASYLYDKKFMWYEEQLGYYTSFGYLRTFGFKPNKEATAMSLSKYRNLTGAMVTYEEALEWLNSVFSGGWKPKEEDRWSLPSWLR